MSIIYMLLNRSRMVLIKYKIYLKIISFFLIFLITIYDAVNLNLIDEMQLKFTLAFSNLNIIIFTQKLIKRMLPNQILHFL